MLAKSTYIITTARFPTSDIRLDFEQLIVREQQSCLSLGEAKQIHVVNGSNIVTRDATVSLVPGKLHCNLVIKLRMFLEMQAAAKHVAATLLAACHEYQVHIVEMAALTLFT